MKIVRCVVAELPSGRANPAPWQAATVGFPTGIYLPYYIAVIFALRTYLLC
ncbi:MAG: hypothetical protein ACREFP_00605 [Acetobacteraceae bacterium]